MAHEFIRGAQAFRVHHAGAINNHGIVQAAAAGKTRRLQRLDLAQHGKGAGTGENAAKTLLTERE